MWHFQPLARGGPLKGPPCSDTWRLMRDKSAISGRYRPSGLDFAGNRANLPRGTGVGGDRLPELFPHLRDQTRLGGDLLVGNNEENPIGISLFGSDGVTNGRTHSDPDRCR